jgi:prevent-host-death family protein
MVGARKKPMQEIAISEFRGKCLVLLERVSRTKTPLRVTRRGKAIADVVPVSAGVQDRSWIGSMAGKMEISGNMVHEGALPSSSETKAQLAGQTGIRRLRGKIRWDGDLDESRRGRP